MHRPPATFRSHWTRPDPGRRLVAQLLPGTDLGLTAAVQPRCRSTVEVCEPPQVYDAEFLGRSVTVPVEAPAIADDVLVVGDASQWDYTHFTLALSRSRRLARWVAWNIDGLRLFPGESIPRDSERFRFDPRIPAESQTGEAVYADNDLDRGHLARRSDLLWGTLDEALAANHDSFFFTNIAPQMAGFNQSGLDGVWGLLENSILEDAGLERRRLSLLGGPVLTDADVVYRDALIPGAFWKVVVYVLDGRASARCFVLAQDVDPLTRAPDLDAFATYEVSLSALEELTSLGFAALHDEGMTVRADAPARLVTDVRDVEW